MKVERKKMAFVEVDITSIASSGNNARRDRWQIDAIQVRTPYGSATRAPLVYAVRRFLLGCFVTGRLSSVKKSLEQADPFAS